MQTEPTKDEAAKLTTLRQAFAASQTLQTSFADFASFAQQALEAEYHASDALKAEHVGAKEYAAWCRWADRKANGG